MDRLELERGTDVLLLESGDDLILESSAMEYDYEAVAEVGIDSTADRQCVYHRYGWR